MGLGSITISSAAVPSDFFSCFVEVVSKFIDGYFLYSALFLQDGNTYVLNANSVS